MLRAPLASSPTAGLNAVFFADASHGWAAGNDGIILATADGGKTWNKQTSGTTKFLNCIHFGDLSHGWSVGFNGTILATADSGKTWNRQTSGTTEDIRSTHFSDLSHGWAVGSNGTILATANGGKTWNKQTSGTTEFLTSTHFSDTSHGWAAGASGAFLTTSDGGKSWSETVLPYQKLPAPWYYPTLLVSLLLFIRGARPLVIPKPTPPVSAIEQISATDRPADPSDPNSHDHLGAHEIAQGLCRFLTNRNTSPPITLAITGDWGSGKSSIMNYLFAQLKREGLRPVWFNAWHHHEEANVLASILEAVQRQAVPPWRLRLRLRLLLKRHWIFPATFFLLAVTACFLAADYLLGGGDFIHSIPALVDTVKNAAKEESAIVGGGVLGLLAILWFKLTAIFGSPLKLLKSFLESTGASGSAEPPGFRLLYERRFRHITQLLGQRRLVLFIDDLDRCEREYTMRVLETTNFLASSGELFMVLGLAPRYVLAHVNMHFKELASAVHELKNGDDKTSTAQASSASFARRYLQKLINIEVPVPKPSDKQVRKMLANEPVESNKQDEYDRRITQGLKWLRTGVLVLLVVAALGYAGWAGMNWQPAPQVTTNPIPASAVVATKTAAPSAADKTDPTVKPPEPRKDDSVYFRPGADPHDGWWITHGIWPLLFGLLALLAALLGWLLHSSHAGRNQLVGELANRLRVWLIGPVQVEDSQAFSDALNIWHELIVSHNPTPRTIKAFLNRLRYFASRMGDDIDSIRQAHLVALATTHYAFDDPAWAMEHMAKTDLGVEIQQNAYNRVREEREKNEKDEKQTRQYQRQHLFLTVLLKHAEFFGSLPDENDRKLFGELVEDIEIHKQE